MDRVGKKRMWTVYASAMLLFLSLPDDEQERLSVEVQAADLRGLMPALVRQAKDRAQALAGDPELASKEVLNGLLDRLMNAKARRDEQSSHRQGGREPGVAQTRARKDCGCFRGRLAVQPIRIDSDSRRAIRRIV